MSAGWRRLVGFRAVVAAGLVLPAATAAAASRPPALTPTTTLVAASAASSGVAVTVAATGSFAVAYQVDSRHDGRQAAASLAVGSLVRKWDVTLGGPGGQLVADDGRVPRCERAATGVDTVII